MEPIPENRSWLNRIAKAHLLASDTVPDPEKLYVLQLMQWGLGRERFQGDLALRPKLTVALKELSNETPEAVQKKLFAPIQPDQPERTPNLRADAEDMANELLRFLLDQSS